MSHLHWNKTSSNKQYIIQQVAYPENTSTDNGKIDYTLETDKTKYSITTCLAFH
jgi:serine-aspartate repeat-containing protein C/D/E